MTSNSGLFRLPLAFLFIFGLFGTRVSIAQTVDPTLNQTVLGGSVYALLQQADGTILMGGSFTYAGATRNGLARFYAPYSNTLMLDGTFRPSVTNAAQQPVYCLTALADGSTLVGGAFTNISGFPRKRIARLLPDGSIDGFFNAKPNNTVYTILSEANGRILIGGAFSEVEGQAQGCVARLHADGSLDTSFASSLSGVAHTLAIAEDQTMIVGGQFSEESRTNYLLRLDENGTASSSLPQPNGVVHCLSIQPDGKLLVGGTFTMLDGVARQRLARLNADGTVDLSFNPEFNGEVRSIAMQADGGVLVGGTFDTVSGQIRSNIARLYPDGTVDTFSANATNNTPNASVHCLMLQQDGKVLAGGNFSSIAGVGRYNVARLINNTPPSSELRLDDTSANWVLGGSSPPVSGAKFSYSTNGLDWFDLPPAQRTHSGWAVSGVNFVSNATLRVQGNASAGYNNGSHTIVSESLGPAAINIPLKDQYRSSGQVLLSVTAAGSKPASYRWSKDGVVISGATLPTYLASATSSILPTTYEVTVSNAFGVVRSSAKLTPYGLDGFDGRASTVFATAFQADGRLLVGGSFTACGGYQRNHIARFNQNDTLDASFDPNADGMVYSLAVEPDHSIIAAGAFTHLRGITRSYIARLTPHGFVNTNFNASINGKIYATALQPDGKILIAGQFTTVDAQARHGFARLNPDGSLDSAFNPNAAPGSLGYSILLQPDGNILIAGEFTAIAGTSRLRIARLYPDGTLDPAFNPRPNNTVRVIALQRDGKVLLGGAFYYVGSHFAPKIARLHADGSSDATFIAEANDQVHSIAVQCDGSILLAGNLSGLNGNGNLDVLAHLYPDGSVNPAYLPRGGIIYGLAGRGDGKYTFGGAGIFFYGGPTADLGRVNATSKTTNHLIIGDDYVEWVRGPSAPEVSAVRFSFWTGTNWFLLPEARRNDMGWIVTNVTLPPNATVRAQAQVRSGYGNGSTGMLEISAGPPVILVQPEDHSLPYTTNTLGTLSLNVMVAGSGPFSFQWFRDGVPLANQTNESTVGTLPINPTSYYVIITTPFGTVQSQPALVWMMGSDWGFMPNTADTIQAIALQTDNLIVFGGAVTNTPGTGIARLLPDGNPDTSFSATAQGGEVRAVAIQTNGKIIIGGSFTNVCGQLRRRIARLNSDGTLDEGFAPVISSAVNCLAIQKDGKILVGNDGAPINAYPIVRLNPDGTSDTSFNPSASYKMYATSETRSIVVQPDGQIIAGGFFYNEATGERQLIVRFGQNGGVNRIYYPDPYNAWQTRVHNLALQKDNSLIAAGNFQYMGGNYVTHVARFDPEGILDQSFTPRVSETIHAVGIQTDGKILIAGLFTNVNGLACNRFARLLPNGTVDQSFIFPGGHTNGSVFALSVQSDGKVILGGSFTNLAGRTRRNLMRLNYTEPAESSLKREGSTFSWRRTGGGTEVSTTTLEVQMSGADTWTYLGEGTRSATGWDFGELAIPAGSILRARGVVSGKSFWLVEQTLNIPSALPPVILVNDGNFGHQSSRFGFNVRGEPGVPFIVERSTDLRNWSPIATNTHSAAPVYFNDPDSTSADCKYYRLRQQ